MTTANGIVSWAPNRPASEGWTLVAKPRGLSPKNLHKVGLVQLFTHASQRATCCNNTPHGVVAQTTVEVDHQVFQFGHGTSRVFCLLSGRPLWNLIAYGF